jgi:hypothetical protein
MEDNAGGRSFFEFFALGERIEGHSLLFFVVKT